MRGLLIRSLVIAVLGFGAMGAAAFISTRQSDQVAAQSPSPTPKSSATPTTATSPSATPSASPTPAPPPPPEAMVVKRILNIPGPIEFGTYYWDTEGVPSDGQLIITVDLEAETMSVFRDGYEIGATAILYGMDGKPTPLGVHDILQKKVHHISNLYHVPMPYMMRLTWDGIAIHASEVVGGSATHGCIGIPIDFAKLLFAQAKLGDKVIITRGQRLGMGGVVTPG